VRAKDQALRPAFAFARGDTPPPVAPRIEVSTSEVRTDSPAVPGVKMALEAGRGTPQGTQFRWLQIEGPRVEMSDPSRPSIEITIPDGAERLAFMLVAAGPDLVRVIQVIVPLRGYAAPSSWGAPPSGKVKADAGDDQVGLVGYRVTLNGSRSRPGDGKHARWLQVGGPPVLAPQQHGPFFSFVPGSPGLYRFLLIVAGDGELSEPDEVSILVGTPPGAGGVIAQPAPANGGALAPSPPRTPEQIVSVTLPRFSGSRRLAADVADVMDAVAQRASLYESFASLQSELARRLDVVIPADPAVRAAWTDGVFSPLSAYSAGQLLAVGLDVRQPQGLEQPLTAAQRDRLRDHFERLARAFRAAETTQ
jgi:hypothetical protein